LIWCGEKEKCRCYFQTMENQLLNFNVIKYINSSLVYLRESFNNQKLDEYFENRAHERETLTEVLKVTALKRNIDYCVGAKETIIALKNGWVSKLIIYRMIEGIICTIKDPKNNTDIDIFVPKNKKVDRKSIISSMEIKQWFYHHSKKLDLKIELYSAQLPDARKLLKDYGTICAILHNVDYDIFQKQILEVDSYIDLL